MADLDLAGIITRTCSDLRAKFAALVHTHAASDITSGTLDAARLPVATTSAVGGVKVDGTTVTISNGVISATGGGVAKSEYAFTLSANSWTHDAVTGQTLQYIDTGISNLELATVIVSCSPSITLTEAWCNSRVVCQEANGTILVFACKTVPAVNLTANVLVLRS